MSLETRFMPLDEEEVTRAFHPLEQVWEHWSKPETFEVEIEVTREDIRNGIEGSGNYCPIASAANRKFGQHSTTVGTNMIIVGPPLLWIELPKKAIRFIHRFDNWPWSRLFLRPFKFRLSLPADFRPDQV